MGKRGRRRARQQPLLAQLGAHGSGDRAGPVAEGWRLDAPMSELLALVDTDSPAALQRALVIPGRNRDTVCDAGAGAFGQAHGDDRTGLVESVVLAVSNRRWEQVARPLLERLEADGILDGHVEALSLVLLEHDVLSVTVPGAWLVDFYVQQRGGDYRLLDPAKTYTLSRRVAPPVRRWAAARQASSRERRGHVLTQARRLESRHAAAAVLGLVDATQDLPATDALEVLELAAGWPAADVRLAALKELVARGLHGEALERAVGDRAAHIRRWAATHRQTRLRFDVDDDAGTTAQPLHPHAEQQASASATASRSPSGPTRQVASRPERGSDELVLPLAGAGPAEPTAHRDLRFGRSGELGRVFT